MKAHTLLISLFIGLLFLACEEETTGPDDTNGEPVQNKILFFRKALTSEDDIQITELCTINPDGTELTILSTGYYVYHGYYFDMQYYLGGRWSPDLEYIATSGGPGTMMEDIRPIVPMWLMSVDGVFLREIDPSADGTVLTWLDDETLVYQKYYPDSELEKININTQESELLYDTPTDDSVYSFCDFYEDNQWLAMGFTPGSSRFDMFFVDVVTGEREYFLHEPQLSMSNGRISPGKDKIAFYGRDIGTTYPLRIFVADIENPDPQQLVVPDSVAKGNFVWNPESSRIAFTGKNGENSNYTDLFIYDLETGEIDTVTNMAKNGWHLEVYDWR